MRKIHFIFGALLLIAGVAYAASNQQKSTPVSPIMQKNLETLFKLQSYAIQPDAFADPANRAEINKLMDLLVGNSGKLPKVLSSHNRPGLAPIANIFSDYLIDMRSKFKNDRRDYVRHQILTATGFCMSCHTGMGTSANLQQMQGEIESLPVSSLRKAEFYAATWQFDRALESFRNLAVGSFSKEHRWLDFSQAARRILSLTVRAKQDPEQTKEVLRELGSVRKLPDFMKSNIRAWQKDVALWESEKPLSPNATAEELLVRAHALSEHARELQTYPSDHSADISYFRVTNMVQQALQQPMSRSQSARAYEILGIAYESLDDPLLWNLDSFYYRECIRQQPHSIIAKGCFDRLAAKIYMGYAGSQGVEIPADEAEKLATLRKMAE